MALQLEDYALLGDTRSAALVGYDGSIDWLCLPRFDSGACFSALLGTPEHGRWLLAPAGGHRATARRYRADTLILETEFTTAEGAVRVVDCMPMQHDGRSDVFRRRRGLSGRVPMRSEVTILLDYGHVVPWFREVGRRSSAFAGPDALTLDADVAHARKGDDLVAEFALAAGDHVEFRLTWSTPRDQPPVHADVGKGIAATERWWRDWAGRCRYDGPYRDAVVRSLITLKAMSYGPSGGIVAAPTTSLPERLGGMRNWDYRFCWIRDATFTLLALLDAGYEAEAAAWREWLLRAVAGRPEQMQLMYGVEGERRLPEFELEWLPGYAGSRRCGSGTRRPSSSSSTSTASSWTPCTRPGPRDPAGGAGMGDAAGAAGLPRVALARPGRRDLGDPRRSPPLRALEGDGMGGGGPRGAGRRASSGSTGRSTTGSACGRRSSTRCATAASTPGAAPSRSTTGRRNSTPRCC